MTGDCSDSCASHSFRIDRCVCVDVTFEQMRVFADDRGTADVAQLRRVFGCAEGCGLCEPYIERMLDSRTVVFTSPLPSCAPQRGA